MSNIDFDEVRRSFRLEDFIAQDLNQVGVKSGGGWMSFKCPWHDDDVPSLGVKLDKQYVTCFAGCMDGGSILDYVIKRDRLQEDDLVGAARILMDKKPLKPLRRPSTLSPAAQKPKVDFLPKVMKLADNVPLGRGFFKNRAIDRIEPRLLTLDNRFEFKRFYNMIEMEMAKNGKLCDGTDLELFKMLMTFNAPRYVIPYIEFGKSYAVQTRRDDDLCLEMMKDSPAIFEAIRIDIAERKKLYDPSLVSDKRLMDAVFGAKYLLWKNGVRQIWNKERIIEKTDSGYSMRPWSSLCVTEGEITAMSLEDILPDAGFPAVGVKTFRNLDKAFSEIGQLFILSENDKPKNGVVASDMLAEKILKASGHWRLNSAKIIKPPKVHMGHELNDFNDFVMLDKRGTIEYLRGFGIELVEREILRLPNLVA